MKVKCINNQNVEESLTVGYSYEIVEDKENSYLIKDNDGFVIEFSKFRFS